MPSGAAAATAVATDGNGGDVPSALPADLVVSTNEPFWQARVEGDHMVLAGIDSVRRLKVASSSVEGTTRVVRASDARGEVLLTARLQPCTDNMSGAPFPMSGTLQMDGQGPSRGCARALAPPPPPRPGPVAPTIPAAFHGHWAATRAACREPAGSIDHLHVGPRGLRFHESIAVPTRVEPVNATTLNLSLDHEGEGQRWTSLQGLQLSGGDSLTIKGPGDSSMRRVLCTPAT